VRWHSLALLFGLNPDCWIALDHVWDRVMDDAPDLEPVYITIDIKMLEAPEPEPEPIHTTMTDADKIIEITPPEQPQSKKRKADAVFINERQDGGDNKRKKLPKSLKRKASSTTISNDQPEVYEVPDKRIRLSEPLQGCDYALPVTASEVATDILDLSLE
jgi:hypothetical protein